jgi:nucleoside phosphorylase
MKALKRAVLAPDSNVRNTEIDGTVFSEAQQGGRRLVIWMSGVSMINAAMSTQLAIDHFHPDAILFSGIAGGLDPSFQPGDVVIPSLWIHQAEAAWLNPDPERPGSYIIPDIFGLVTRTLAISFPTTSGWCGRAKRNHTKFMLLPWIPIYWP